MALAVRCHISKIEVAGAPLDLTPERATHACALPLVDLPRTRPHRPWCGGGLTLQGGTLLHVAAEYGHPAAAALLLDRGADVNARATVDEAGIGGHTAIFHAVTQFEFDDGGLPVTQLLIDRGADLTVRAKLPGNYEISPITHWAA